MKNIKVNPIESCKLHVTIGYSQQFKPEKETPKNLPPADSEAFSELLANEQIKLHKYKTKNIN